MKCKRGLYFNIKSGDYHALDELSAGTVPLIACGEEDNGFVGFFDIPDSLIYSHALTVAYNGLPLTCKYHPYSFGAKDDVAVLFPKKRMTDAALFYIAAYLNRSRWRYSYGRKCYKAKLKRFEIELPNDLKQTSKIVPFSFKKFLPQQNTVKTLKYSKPKWVEKSIREFFNLVRGDFHSIARLESGKTMTVSRVSGNNGVVGFYERPKGANIYPRGLITVSTVGGDAFVQLNDFMATDNVIICLPRVPMRTTTLFFLAMMLNQQKWRYSYGRQCYKAKLERMTFYVPLKSHGQLDQELMQQIVVTAPYWNHLDKRLPRLISA